MRKKIRVGVLFGGKSAEHEISLLSAKNVIDAIDCDKYEVIPIGIGKNGEWHIHDGRQFLMHAESPKSVHLKKASSEVALVCKENGKSLVSIGDESFEEPLDVVFPVLHGTYGEDGTVQGLLKLANVPFVGAGVLGSAVGMDKDVMKRLLRDAGLPCPKFLTLRASHPPSFEDVSSSLGLPFFVKPANLGSSVGVSKVKTEADFQRALELAFQYDHKVLAEENIVGREIECCVLGNDPFIASLPGEVTFDHHEFYSYEAKYFEERGAVFQIPALLGEQETRAVQELAIKTCQALCCEGMARVDLFLNSEGRVWINEINTIPGFTNTSMCPQLWAASGISLPDLTDRLLQLAIERFQREKRINTNYQKF